MEIEPAKDGAKGGSAPTGLELWKKRGGRLLWSTGKAAWIAGTTVLVLIVPLIIEMDREQQMMDMESQQMNVLSGAQGAAPAAAPAK